MHSNFIRTARAKGLPTRSSCRHALKPALLPVIRYEPVGDLVDHRGTGDRDRVLRPGIGKLIVNGAGNRDYTLVLGLVVLITVLAVTLNLLVDLAYAALDPKIRIEIEAPRMSAPFPAHPEKARMRVRSLRLSLAPSAGRSGQLSRSPWFDARDRFMRNKAAVASLVVLPLIALVCIVGPSLLPYEFDTTDWDAMKLPPTLAGHALVGHGRIRARPAGALPDRRTHLADGGRCWRPCARWRLASPGARPRASSAARSTAS